MQAGEGYCSSYMLKHAAILYCDPMPTIEGKTEEEMCELNYDKEKALARLWCTEEKATAKCENVDKSLTALINICWDVAIDNTDGCEEKDIEADKVAKGKAAFIEEVKDKVFCGQEKSDK